jgi:outer membrane biosynthesis protein TonB
MAKSAAEKLKEKEKATAQKENAEKEKKDEEKKRAKAKAARSKAKKKSKSSDSGEDRESDNSANPDHSTTTHSSSYGFRVLPSFLVPFSFKPMSQECGWWPAAGPCGRARRGQETATCRYHNTNDTEYGPGC